MTHDPGDPPPGPQDAVWAVWSGVRDPYRPPPAAPARAFALESDPVFTRSRITALIAVFVLIFAALGGRAAQVVLTRDPAPPQLARETPAPAAQRADIVDRNGQLLAATITAYTAYADARQVWDPDATAAALAAVIPALDRDQLAGRLASKRAYVPIRRGLTPRQMQAVFDLGLAGVAFEEEARRVYPLGPLAAHVLGYVDYSGRGVRGVERAFDGAIRAQGGANEPVKLTLDLRIQFALEAELAAVASEFQAKGGAGVVIDARSGEVLALASWPAFDPNEPGDADEASAVNRAEQAYEMGSTFKPFTVAMALDSGAVGADAVIDVATPLPVADRLIRDAHPLDGVQTLADVLAHSSNIGVAKLALALPPDVQRSFLANLGLLEPVALGPDNLLLSRPQAPRTWEPITAATVAYGHGVAVSPIQLAAAFGAIANDGVLVAPTLAPRAPGSEPARRRAMTADTAHTVLGMLRRVVTDGTGTRADAPGYGVAGKTGTAEVPIPGGYAKDRRVSSFAAVFPVWEPRYALLVLLEEPQGVAETGGEASAAVTAAPSVGRLVDRIAPILGVEPRFEAAAPVMAALPVRQASAKAPD